MQINKINKNFVKNKKNIKALQDINMKIKNGAITVLLGPNGSGKTTLIKIICGLIYPDSGNISGLELVNERKSYKNISVVLEGARNLLYRLKVRDNFYYFATIKGMSKKDITKKVNYYVSKFDLEHIIDTPVYSLSLGQKQIVSLICALVVEPKIVLLDEPSNGLDIYNIEILTKILQEEKSKSNTAFLISSHDINFVKPILDYGYIIKNGIIIDFFEGTNEIRDKIELY